MHWKQRLSFNYLRVWLQTALFSANRFFTYNHRNFRYHLPSVLNNYIKKERQKLAAFLLCKALGTNMNPSFNLEDAIQLAIGSFALAVPISFSENA